MVDVVVVGAGLAGLCCAVRLEGAGLSVKLLEAEDAPGGRIRTDHVDGFRLDHGFQILLTGYPELVRHFALKALRLLAFAKGALCGMVADFIIFPIHSAAHWGAPSALPW